MNEFAIQNYFHNKRRIEVLYGRTHTVAAIVLYVFLGGLGLLLIVSSIKPSGVQIRGIVIGALSLSPALAVFFLRSNAAKKSVKSLDANGATRGDGKHFLWSDFRGVVERVGTLRYGGKTVWRTELTFANGGVVWIIPQRIKNYDEVFQFVNALPRAVLKDI